MIIDTGASTDILNAFTKVNPANQITLNPPTKRIFAYGAESQQLTVLGQFRMPIETGGKTVVSTIHVLRGNHGSLLSYETASNLGLIKVRINQISDENQVCDELIQQYPNLFKGIGKLKNAEVKLHINEEVPPVAQAARRIPFHIRSWRVSKSPIPV